MSACAQQPDSAGQGVVPDFRETYELPEGLYRRSVPAFAEKVLRELLVNALVQRYSVAPTLLRGAKVPTVTTLARIGPHRLQALILEDLARYPGSSRSDVNRRIGTEISAKTLKRALDDLAQSGRVGHAGERRWRRYPLCALESIGQVASKLP